MSQPEAIDAAMEGPWFAYLSDNAGFIAESAADLDGAPGEISIRRGSARPADSLDDQLPGSCHSADIFMTLDLDDLDEGTDEEIEERLALAHAAAEGMNQMLFWHKAIARGDSGEGKDRV